MKKILVIGSSNVDVSIRATSIPKAGETVKGLFVSLNAGGKGANQAVACSRLGGNTGFITVLGSEGSSSLLPMFHESGIDCRGIDVLDGKQTGTAYITVDNDGKNTIVVIPGTNYDCSADYIKSKDYLIQEFDIIVLQLEIPEEAVDYAIKRSAELGKTVILNPAPAPASLNPDWLSKIDYLTPNETELEKISGMSVSSVQEAKIAAQSLISKGVKNVIATLGGGGALLVSSSCSEQFTPPDIKVVDTTAAGDTFNGAVAVYLAEGKDISEAIVFANAAATLSVSRKGAQESIPSRDETEKFLASLAKEGAI